MIMSAVVFCIAGWEELQTASYKFRGEIIVLHTLKSNLFLVRDWIFFKRQIATYTDPVGRLTCFECVQTVLTCIRTHLQLKTTLHLSNLHHAFSHQLSRSATTILHV